MRLLLDTHALVWWLRATSRLSRRAFDAISDPDNQVLVSAASAYEIEYKRTRDPLLAAVPEPIGPAVFAQDFDWLAVTPEVAAAAARLPPHHGDPWDRILVAHAADQQAVIVTVDGKIAAYGAPVLW
jgi:PIN domain nuclease of toxin-antitoxin system